MLLKWQFENIETVSDFALNADGDKNPWARVSVGLSYMNLTTGQAYY